MYKKSCPDQKEMETKLWNIFQKHHMKYPGRSASWYDAIKKDLINWKLDYEEPAPQDPKKVEWCSHADNADYLVLDKKLSPAIVMFCPFCGAPRPSQESRRDKLRKILYTAGCGRDWEERFGESENFYLNLADAALQFIKEEEGE